MAATRQVVVDTHAFLWWRREDRRRLSPQAWNSIERADEVIIADVVLWEIAMLDEKRDATFEPGVRAWLGAALDDHRIVVQPITPEIAYTAVSIGRWLQLDPADHLIAATALVLGAPLVTKDGELARLPGLEVIW